MQWNHKDYYYRYPNVRPDLFYLLDYITLTGKFQIGDRKKKKKKKKRHGETYHYKS